jgi:DNA polymerase III subunit epsilon
MLAILFRLRELSILAGYKVAVPMNGQLNRTILRVGSYASGMVWRHRGAASDIVERKLAAPNGLTAGSGASPLKFEARLEVVEDGRVVLSRPILALPSHLPPRVALRDISADLDSGRRLGAGEFVALDFETATASRDSACAVAVAAVEGGRVTKVGRWLIQPPDNNYQGFNIAIHGITPEMTANSPSMANVWPEVLQWIGGRPLVAHYAPFDLSVLRHSLSAAGSDWPELVYFCTCALARRAWPGRLSYRLPDLATECGLTFAHHDPGADAATAGELAIACCGVASTTTLEGASKALGMIPGRLTRNSWTANGIARTRLADLTPTVDTIPDDSDFKDRIVVFTGTLSCGLTRPEAAQLVVNSGGTVASTISRKVNYLVLGMQDAYRVKDGEHSTKMLKAAELRAAGFPIELLAEDDFLRMLPA